MPSRLLREGILDSDAVNTLTWGGEVFYRRLMSVVDDYGRFDGRAAVLRSRLYPLKISSVSEADVSSWLAECQMAGLVSRYSVEGRPYILFHKLGAQQRTKAKFPGPSSEADLRAPVNNCEQVLTGENNCSQLRASSCSGSGSGSGAHTGSGSGALGCPEAAKPPPSGPPVLTYPTIGTEAKEWHLTEPKLAEYVEAFPALDVLAECRKALQWLRDDPGRRKTPKGMPKFLGGWLGRAKPAQHAIGPATLRDQFNASAAEFLRMTDPK